ncbi:hypothetical protein HOY82DRAFT_610520 [Tuber indicum]|nr:hypothetical protein HOY82DRAFT_610520 [Tuber indicum]
MDLPTTNSISTSSSPGTDANTTWLAQDIGTLPDFLELLPELCDTDISESCDFDIYTLPESCDTDTNTLTELCDFDIPELCDSDIDTLQESCHTDTNAFTELCTIDPNSLPPLPDFLELLAEPMDVESGYASWDLGMDSDGTIFNVGTDDDSEMSEWTGELAEQLKQLKGDAEQMTKALKQVHKELRGLAEGQKLVDEGLSVLDSYVAQLIPWSFIIHNAVHKTNTPPAEELRYRILQDEEHQDMTWIEVAQEMGLDIARSTLENFVHKVLDIYRYEARTKPRLNWSDEEGRVRFANWTLEMINREAIFVFTDETWVEIRGKRRQRRQSSPLGANPYDYARLKQKPTVTVLF